MQFSSHLLGARVYGTHLSSANQHPTTPPGRPISTRDIGGIETHTTTATVVLEVGAAVTVVMLGVEVVVVVEEVKVI